MVKQGVTPDELTKPFWKAANEGRLVIQNCNPATGFSIRRQRNAVSVVPVKTWSGSR